MSRLRIPASALVGQLGPVLVPTQAVPHRPVAATGNPELDRVTSAARWWRDALAERDTAILDAFAAGILGQDIAAAASMSVAGVYRLRQRAVGEFHR